MSRRSLGWVVLSSSSSLFQFSHIRYSHLAVAIISPLNLFTFPPILVSEYFAAVTILHLKALIFLAAPSYPSHKTSHSISPSTPPDYRNQPPRDNLNIFRRSPFYQRLRPTCVIASSTRGLHVPYLPTRTPPSPSTLYRHHPTRNNHSRCLFPPTPIERASVTTSPNA